MRQRDPVRGNQLDLALSASKQRRGLRAEHAPVKHDACRHAGEQAEEGDAAAVMGGIRVGLPERSTGRRCSTDPADA